MLCNQLQLVPHFSTDKQTLKHQELYTALYSRLLNPFKLYLILKPTNHIITLIANLCRVGIQKKQHIKEYRNIVKYKIKQYYIIVNIIIIPYGSIKQHNIT